MGVFYIESFCKGETSMSSNSASVPYHASTSFATESSQTGALSRAIVLIGRLLFSLIFIFAGPGHFSSQTIAYAASQGVPLASIAVPFSGMLALAGGLSILLGYRARVGAWLLVLFLVPVTPLMHNFWAVKDPMMAQMQMAMFLKNLSMLGGALLISQFGAGPWSLDARRGSR
jgi:putative oxidoreductase